MSASRKRASTAAPAAPAAKKRPVDGLPKWMRRALETAGSDTEEPEPERESSVMQAYARRIAEDRQAKRRHERKARRRAVAKEHVKKEPQPESLPLPEDFLGQCVDAIEEAEDRSELGKILCAVYLGQESP